ncbi:hypothetical protein NPX13_g6641 [Xylaria arbuscula]|uniref:DUF3824 domain-containing protein n=1 Tax=Xylaria arbuscula TaxID=114810 RepID=A0A9W8NBU3_9PEZI|nr:hypothetical protein NPX13_g6641 [Xylaria arbuscula]
MTNTIMMVTVDTIIEAAVGGAAALAVAGGLKYMQNNKAEKEEAHRGRRRRRYSNDSYSSRSVSRRGRSRSKSNVAKAGAATAAIAGLVHHYRSKSRAEIAAAGLTGAAATKLWERHKDKKDRENHEASDDEYYRDRSISRSRSRSRSLGRHHHPRDTTADRELGLVHVPDVEYGSEPLEPYESASEEPRRRRRKHRQRHRSASGSGGEVQKKRSKSTLRDVGAAALGTAAAAIGIKKYSDHQKNKDRGENPSEDSIGHSRSRDRSDRARDRRSRDRYEEGLAGDTYRSGGYDAEMPPSPLHASGGFPPTNQAPPPPPAVPGGFTQHPNQSTANLNAPYPPYNPQDYVNLPPPPPGPPPHSPQPYFPPPGGPGHHPGPENVSEVPQNGDSRTPPDGSGSATTKQDGIRAKSKRSLSSSSSSASSVSSVTESKRTGPKVHFRPLSPESSRVLQQRREVSKGPTSDVTNTADSPKHEESRNLHARTRSSSEPSSSRRALTHRGRRPRSVSPNSSDDDDIVNLPDRFDPSGRPLDPRDRSLNRSRRPSYGGFEYRPQHPGDMHIRGEWAALPLEGIDTAQIAQTIGGLLQGQGGFLGTLGHLLQDVPRR